MRTGITSDVTAAKRIQLEAIIASPTSPQKHVWRAKIILMSDDGFGTFAIMEATGKPKSRVSCWQERFLSEGVDGLLDEKSRPPALRNRDPKPFIWNVDPDQIISAVRRWHQTLESIS